jgi:GNAT superfamily N-acetyltransferase
MIRQAVEKDAVSIHDIHTRAVRGACKVCYTEKQISGWLKNRTPEGYLNSIRSNEIYVAEINKRIVGFGHAVPGEIVAIFVDPEFHKKGLGKALLEYGLNIAKTKNHKKIKLEATLNAADFYKKCGFIEIGKGVATRGGQKLDIVLMEYSAK